MHMWPATGIICWCLWEWFTPHLHFSFICPLLSKIHDILKCCYYLFWDIFTIYFLVISTDYNFGLEFRTLKWHFLVIKMTLTQWAENGTIWTSEIFSKTCHSCSKLEYQFSFRRSKLTAFLVPSISSHSFYYGLILCPF